MISEYLDKISDRLEAKGMKKEAMELDKVSNSIEKLSRDGFLVDLEKMDLNKLTDRLEMWRKMSKDPAEVKKIQQIGNLLAQYRSDKSKKQEVMNAIKEIYNSCS